jgi:tetratricopeptide (TPR) repeat protein
MRVFAIAMLLVATVPAQTPPVTASTVLAIEHWVDAVKHHVPGQADDPLMSIEGMSVGDRAQVRAGMDLFLTGLSQKPARISFAAQKRIVDLGIDLARNPGVKTFVDRAIMLHGDAAMVAIDHPEFVPSNAGTVTQPAKSVGLPEQVLERDGELVGTTAPNWNWAFARSLIALRPPQADTAFLATWFHATSTFLMSRRHYGDAQTHLIAAAVVVPKDAMIRFDRAAYAELMGLPESQVLLTTEDIALQRASQGSLMRGTLMSRSDAAKRTGVRPANVENAEAERLFRSALDVEPEFVEARVRLARLLEVRGRHAEAARELARALSGREHADPAVAFFAHLFAGRVDRALGKLDTAAAHFQDALALFPNAQSALLGASQVAVLRADVEGALASVRQLEVANANASADAGTDPWWNYGIGLGRNANALLAAMWANARRQ